MRFQRSTLLKVALGLGTSLLSFTTVVSIFISYQFWEDLANKEVKLTIKCTRCGLPLYEWEREEAICGFCRKDQLASEANSTSEKGHEEKIKQKGLLDLDDELRKRGICPTCD